MYAGHEGSKFCRPDPHVIALYKYTYIPPSQKGLYLGVKEMSLKCLKPGGDLGIREITFPSHYKLEENYSIL
jgi:hypothetical protein